jgi:hypothetical protein
MHCCGNGGERHKRQRTIDCGTAVRSYAPLPEAAAANARTVDLVAWSSGMKMSDSTQNLLGFNHQPVVKINIERIQYI